MLRRVQICAGFTAAFAGVGLNPALSGVADPIAPVVFVAGDIACATTDPNYNGGEGTAAQCRQKHTSQLVLAPDAVFTLGDHQYPIGTLSQFNAVYDGTWGWMKSVTYPTPGDHDYGKTGGKGYFAYFGVAPYYSFDLAQWHWVSLNSEIDHARGSAQEQWLRRDLQATDKPCVGAYWSTPVFTSGKKGFNASFLPLWEALYEARADIILAGDTHNYERFAKQTPSGAAAPDGIRQFVVGTGGRSLDGFPNPAVNSEVRRKAFGVLKLVLQDGSYTWQFVPETVTTATDSGSAACNPTSTAPPVTATP